VETIKQLLEEKRRKTLSISTQSPFGKKLTHAKLFVVCDLDGTLVDKEHTNLIELKQWIDRHSKKVVFGLATGRSKVLTGQALADYDLPHPDILICSAGSEIYYTENFVPDKGWESHIDFQWDKEALQNALAKFPDIKLQEPEAQWRFKISYYVDSDFGEDEVANLYKFLDDRKLKVKVLLTENRFLDILPYRASKGSAVRYLSYKWKMPLNQIITAGNSGNDIDMLRAKTKGIVVANHSPEMEALKKSKHIYFSKAPLSNGVMEGINYHLASHQELKAMILEP
jgi:sucrose-phosphate synthase